MRRSLLLLAAAGLAPMALLGCSNQASTEPGDPSVPIANPSALGTGSTNAELNIPDASTTPVNGQMVNVTGSSFVWLDTYAETPSASSIGSIYVQDFTASDAGGQPYSGMLLFKTVFVPASLQLWPGDVVDYSGEYQDYGGPSTFLFPPGQTIPEMYEPILTFRFDYKPVAPTPVDITDLKDSALNFAPGYKWVSMLVTVTPTVPSSGVRADGNGRLWVFLTEDTSEAAVALDNELMALDPAQFAAGTQITSVTGIVTYFDSFHIAPRTPADIVFANPPAGDAGADAQ